MIQLAGKFMRFLSISYIRKLIVFFYIIFMPIVMLNALAGNNLKTEEPAIHLQEKNTSEPDIPHAIIENIQTANRILSSSPSELTEQAKSYALNKFNVTASSELHKWLSQFGAAKINFGLDKKGTLKNNSLELLLPIYDNKADWLFFSQLSYRRKDNRNTINVGLGGRYFYQNWMYGLNTFYDHDFTGNNQRLGLGGEIWGDYIKFSANTYWRLSSWQGSRNFENYYERTANGYDINGEFFLPAYPHLGMKLTYEQYFGNNVTLFNSDTKQKNPSLAKLGLTYTPIPLFTMGVDYKQGESSHTETQFLANINYKFGIPLSAQLSQSNVSFIRTLAGSRYDFVERNNNIILEHQKKEKEELIAMAPIIGYGHQEIKVNSPLLSDADIKQTHWVVTDKEFKKNNGKLSSELGNSITVTLPSYQETHQNDYILNILPESKKGRQIKPIEVHIKVLPFLIDGKVNIISPELPAATGKKENGYTFVPPIITYTSSPSGTFVKNAQIDKVTWTTEPALANDSGLEFLWNEQPAKTNDKGELTNENGQLIPNILYSKKPYDKIDVYIQLDGAPRQKIGSVKFDENKSHQYQVKSIVVDNKGPLIANGETTYTYTAYIVDGNGKKAPEGQKITNIHWDKNNNTAGLKLTFKNDVDNTGPDGTLTAKLSSTAVVDDVVVSLSVEEQKIPVSAEKVAFSPDKSSYHIDGGLTASPKGPLTVGDGTFYTFTAKIIDRENQAVVN
ncbi:hypothetical protein FE392_13925, partial [Xenorhabdus sp. 12]